MITLSNRRLSLTLAALAALGLAGTAAHAQSFTAGSLVVSQIGTTGSSTALTSAAAQVYLDEFTTSGTQIFSTPVTGLTNSGSASSEGALSLSSNGQYLLLTGYNAPVGTAAVAGTSNTSATPVNRGIAEVNPAGTISTSFFTDGSYNGNNIRSAASTNGTTVYTAGPTTTGVPSGLASTVFGSGTGTSLLSTASSVRVTNIQNNELYYSLAGGIFDVGPVGNTGSPVSLFMTGTTVPASAYDFLFANATTLFVADDTSSTGGLLEYTSPNGTDGSFTLAKTFSTGLSNGLRSITTNGTDIFGITGSSTANSLLDFNLANGTFTTLATAGTNTIFRGVDFAPTVPAAVPEASTTVSFGLLLALGLGGFAVAKKRSVRAS